MNKTELITKMTEKTGLTKKNSEAAINAFMESIEEALESGDKVQLVGFGTFQNKKRAAREGINPRTKEIIQIAETIVPSFKAGKSFKEKVNK